MIVWHEDDGGGWGERRDGEDSEAKEGMECQSELNHKTCIICDSQRSQGVFRVLFRFSAAGAALILRTGVSLKCGDAAGFTTIPVFQPKIVSGRGMAGQYSRPTPSTDICVHMMPPARNAPSPSKTSTEHTVPSRHPKISD